MIRRASREFRANLSSVRLTLVDGLPQEFEHGLFRQAVGVSGSIDGPSPAVPYEPFLKRVTIPKILPIQGNQPARVSVVVIKISEQTGRWCTGPLASALFALRLVLGLTSFPACGGFRCTPSFTRRSAENLAHRGPNFVRSVWLDVPLRVSRWALRGIAQDNGLDFDLGKAIVAKLCCEPKSGIVSAFTGDPIECPPDQQIRIDAPLSRRYMKTSHRRRLLYDRGWVEKAEKLAQIIGQNVERVWLRIAKPFVLAPFSAATEYGIPAVGSNVETGPSLAQFALAFRIKCPDVPSRMFEVDMIPT